MADRANPIPAELPGPDVAAGQALAARAAAVLRPTGALARFDEVAAWLAQWQRTNRPAVERPVAIVFVADHGVAAEGVSAYPAAVTSEMLRALQDGVATASAMARSVGALVSVVDCGTGRPTGNIRTEAALTEDRFATAWAGGAEAVQASDSDLLVFGEMGIGNTTAAAAVAAVLHGGPVEGWVGRGTGVDDAGWARKVDVVEQARARIHGTTDPLEVLRQVGGAELVAIAGAIVEARVRSVPVLLDGYVVTAAAAALEASRPGLLDHCVAAHLSPEPGHAALLGRLGRRPLLDLDMRLGEGSGALAAVPLVRLAATVVVDVATFADRGLRGES